MDETSTSKTSSGEVKIASSSAADQVQDQDRRSRVRVRNRRRIYLDRNPAYFASPDLELADPLLYDRCIRHFQSAAEREAEGRSKGYSGSLEADLYRSEAKLAALAAQSNSHSQHETFSNPVQPDDDGASENSSSTHKLSTRSQISSQKQIASEVPLKLVVAQDDTPRTKEEGLQRWKAEMISRFVEGRDDEFDYDEIDNTENVEERREDEDKWFEAEEEGWAIESGEENSRIEVLEGETGVQDF